MATAVYERVLRTPGFTLLGTAFADGDVVLQTNKDSGGWALKLQWIDGMAVIQYGNKPGEIAAVYAGDIKHDKAHGSGMYLTFDVGGSTETIGSWENDLMVMGQYETSTRQECGQFNGKHCRGLLTDKRPATDKNNQTLRGLFSSNFKFSLVSDVKVQDLLAADQCIANARIEVEKALCRARTCTSRFVAMLQFAQRRAVMAANPNLKRTMDDAAPMVSAVPIIVANLTSARDLMCCELMI